MLIIDFLGMKLYKKDGMGFGDVKLFAAVGILTGILGTVCTFAMSLITATVFFTVIIASSKIKAKKNTSVQTENIENTENADVTDEDENDISSKSYLAFGPYISMALIIYIVLFDVINYLANLYLDLF